MSENFTSKVCYSCEVCYPLLQYVQNPKGHSSSFRASLENVQTICQVRCMSYVLCLMSYVLCLMSYVLHLMSYVLFLMSYVFFSLSHVLCLMPYILYSGFLRPLTHCSSSNTLYPITGKCKVAPVINIGTDSVFI